MHLLQAQPGAIADGAEPVDLGQSPGDIVVLSAADTELANLAAAHARLPAGAPSLRLANLMHLSHNLSVDLYLDRVVAEAKLVVVRLLGGSGYWPYGVEQLTGLCRERAIPLALVPGDDQPDAELAGLSSLPRDVVHRLWQYCVHGGPDNALNFLGYAASLVGAELPWVEPKPLLRAGPYWPGLDQPDLAALQAQWRPGQSVAAIVFYRALLQAGNLAPVDGLIAALQEQGINPLPIYCASLKDPVSAETVVSLLAESEAALVLNCTGFAVSSPGGARKATPFDEVPGPVLQVVFSGGTEAAWAEGAQGLSARDIAMNVALPEVDGRILSRTASFKSEARFDPATQCSVVEYAAVTDRIDFIAALARGWIELARAPAAERRLAIVLANYPNKDGRLGNGVGLDTPAGTLEVLSALDRRRLRRRRPAGERPGLDRALGRRADQRPDRPQASRSRRRALRARRLSRFFASLPESVRQQVTERWGAPEDDPFVLDGAFVLSAFRLGNVVIGLQPARGYNIDPVQSYHDPALVPPHGYLAFYAWLRRALGVQAVVHMGKHGNMEWLPGKALSLSEACFPEAAFGPAAAPLSLHRQRSRRGHPGQAPGSSGDYRPPDAAPDPGRELRAPWPTWSSWSTSTTRPPGSTRAGSSCCAGRSSS